MQTRFVTLLTLAWLCSACAPAQPPAPPPPPPVDIAAESRALDGLATEYMRLYAAKDAAGLAQLYTVDAVRIQVKEGTQTGRDAIQTALASAFPPDGTAKLSVQRKETMVTPNGNNGAAYGDYEVELAPGKGPALKGSGSYMNLYVKVDGAWKIARSMVAPAVDIPRPAAKP